MFCRTYHLDDLQYNCMIPSNPVVLKGNDEGTVVQLAMRWIGGWSYQCNTKSRSNAIHSIIYDM